MSGPATWAIVALALAGMSLRPWRTAEWHWAGGGALALLALRLTSPAHAWAAIARGADVYAFLIGIMALGELARANGVFERFAMHALRAAGGSRARLLALVYATGIAVTAFLSNDTTAVLLTPAVFAVLRPIGGERRPYLYAGAFAAGAGSFVLPFSNPANLLLFGRSLPALGPWLHGFGAAAAGSILATFGALALASRRDLRAPYRPPEIAYHATPGTRRALVAMAGAALALSVAAALRWDLGATALAAAAGALALVSTAMPSAPRLVARHVSWPVLPMVAGLFVLVDTVDRLGTLGVVRNLLLHAGTLAWPAGNAEVAAALTVAANLLNNLPVALAAGYVVQNGAIPPAISHTALAAIDLGSNLAVSGSLATLLWMVAVRREGVEVTPFEFLRIGLWVTLPALVTVVFLVR